MMPTELIYVVIGFVLLIGLFAFFYFIPVRLYLAAIAAKANVSLISLIGMRIRRVNPNYIVNPLIQASKAGLNITTDELESHYLSNGHVSLVVTAMISADKANIPLTWEKATAIDLAGRNVLEAVQMSVKPAVIDCPDPRKGKSVVEAVAKDGIQLKAKARVTVRANLERLVGGATEETIIARVGEGIVTSIGSAESHKEVLENPDIISRRVLEKGLDSGTGFEILSIDIADIDVGDNIGAKLNIDKAEADKKMAQAKAEERRAMAIAAEQEFKAREQEMRAKVVEAEAQVPLALADAFRKGHLGVMDYYNMQNVKADTKMRENIATPENPSHPNPEGR
ncbi:flotillin-like protein FloA [Candidatus Sumerlaeota bacterium]|nr:flotillin-like protein FloA [Candidatus Sumerlaeota bacterium]